MHYKEFKSQVKAQEVKLPINWGVSGWFGPYADLHEFDSPGSGYNRDYSAQDVKLVVAWCRIMELTGHPRSKDSKRFLRYEATQLLAQHDTGWIVMSEGQVWWEKDQPGVQVFDKGAVCLKVSA